LHPFNPLPMNIGNGKKDRAKKMVNQLILLKELELHRIIGNSWEIQQSIRLFLNQDAQLFGFLDEGISIDLEDFGGLRLVPFGRFKNIEDDPLFNGLSNS